MLVLLGRRGHLGEIDDGKNIPGAHFQHRLSIVACSMAFAGEDTEQQGSPASHTQELSSYSSLAGSNLLPTRKPTHDPRRIFEAVICMS